MANLNTLALYVAAGIDVDHKAHGRGLLVGLPFSTSPYEATRACVKYPGEPGPFPDYEDLGDVVPVLYHTSDMPVLCRAAIGNPVLVATLRQVTALELEYWASVVDYARSLHIALNLPPTAYIRKELPLTNA